MHKPTHGRYQCLHRNRLAANMQKPSHTKKRAHLRDWNSIKILFCPHFTNKGDRRHRTVKFTDGIETIFYHFFPEGWTFFCFKSRVHLWQTVISAARQLQVKNAGWMHTNTQHNTSGKEHYLSFHSSPAHSMPHQWQLKPCDLACFFVATGLPTTLICYKVASQWKNLCASSKSHAGGNVPFFFQSD